MEAIRVDRDRTVRRQPHPPQPPLRRGRRARRSALFKYTRSIFPTISRYSAVLKDQPVMSNSPGLRPSEDDPEDALRIQQQRYAQRIQRRLQEEREVAGTIEGEYRAAWVDFYSLEPEQCEQLIRSLEVVSPHPPLSLDDLFEDAEYIEMSPDPTPSEASFDIWLSDLQQRSQFSAEVALTLHDMDEYAYRKYESCTPSVEGILYNGDPRILKFIPCADESGFRAELYASRHLQLAWQTEWFDVDCK